MLLQDQKLIRRFVRWFPSDPKQRQFVRRGKRELSVIDEYIYFFIQCLRVQQLGIYSRVLWVSDRIVDPIVFWQQIICWLAKKMEKCLQPGKILCPTLVHSTFSIDYN